MAEESTRGHGAEGSAREAIRALPNIAPAFWLHTDLDVLRTEDFPAADYTQPGWLTWGSFSSLPGRRWQCPECVGCSIVIYNPDLDPARRAAARIVSLRLRSVSA